MLNKYVTHDDLKIELDKQKGSIIDLTHRDLKRELKLTENRLMNKIIKKLNVVINGFDRMYLGQEKRIRGVEQHLGIKVDVN